VVNRHLINMISEVMVKNNQRLKMWLKVHPDGQSCSTLIDSCEDTFQFDVCISRKWCQINQNLKVNHSDQMQISNAFRILYITDWWRQQEEMHSKYADLGNFARHISIISHSAGVEI